MIVSIFPLTLTLTLTLKKCTFKPSTQTTIFPHMNGLLLHGFRQITCYTYAYNIISYFKYLLLSQMFPVTGFLKKYLRNQTRP